MIFKAEEKSNDKSPDFKLVAKINDKFTNVGAGWSRKTKEGKPFISLKLSNPFKDFKGYHLVEDENPTQTLPGTETATEYKPKMTDATSSADTDFINF